MSARILIVEDEVVIAMEIESMLEQLGYEVVGHASRGEEAIDLAEQFRPDLILMDIRLKTEMDGIATAEIIFRQFMIPIVFLTAHSDPSTLERAMNLQPYGYILKPFRKNDLYTSVEIALYKHRALTAEQDLRRELFKLHVIDHVTQYDIYNKVLALSGFFGILEMELPESFCGREHFSKIKGLINNIHDQIRFEENYHKLGSGASEWHPVSGLIDEARGVVIPDSIRIENCAGPLEIHADPLFRKVLPQIFENSVKHGGKVTVIRISFRKKGDNGSLSIEDDGCGVVTEQKNSLLTTDLLNARGKGLFLVREILQVSGLSISETGEPGKGARFEILIPRGKYRMPGGEG